MSFVGLLFRGAIRGGGLSRASRSTYTYMHPHPIHVLLLLFSLVSLVHYGIISDAYEARSQAAPETPRRQRFGWQYLLFICLLFHKNTKRKKNNYLKQKEQKRKRKCCLDLGDRIFQEPSVLGKCAGLRVGRTWSPFIKGLYVCVCVYIYTHIHIHIHMYV